MNYIVLHNGKPVKQFKQFYQAIQFKKYCRKEYRLVTTIEAVLV